MSLNLPILPLQDYGKLCVPQKCLLPAAYMPKTIRCGSWVKCELRDTVNENSLGYVVCQIYPQGLQEEQIFAYMDDAVTIDSFKIRNANARLSKIAQLQEITVNSIEVIFVLSLDFFRISKKAINKEELKDSALILLQGYSLTANCIVRNKQLIGNGIMALHVKAKDCEEDHFYEINEEMTLSVDDVQVQMPMLPLQAFHCVGFEKPLEELDYILKQSRQNSPMACLNALIVGPAGCGKSSMLTWFVEKNKCNYFHISTENILGQYPGETESKLREIFAIATQFVRNHKPKEPTIILLEDLHLLCPTLKKDNNKDSGHSLRLCGQLNSLIDDLKSEKLGIICLATTIDAKALYRSVRSPGRFQQEIAIEAINEMTRRKLFTLLFKDRFPDQSLDDSILDLVVAHTPGYVVADLALLVRSMEQMKMLNKADSNMSSIITEILKKSKPTSLRASDVTVIKASDGFEIIGGMQTLKETLKLNILAGLKKPEAYRRFNLNLPKGILLYGPPGCAKTTIAKCLAAEAKMTFIATSAAEVYSPYVGCAEKFLSNLFDTARKHAPCLIFLDEIDSLVGCRVIGGGSGSNEVQTRILATLLTEMDGIVQSRSDAEAYILVVAATNRPNMIDDALVRPGRFDQLIHVPPPDCDSRLSILELYRQHMPFSADCDLLEIAQRTENFSGADLCNLCNEAAMHALQRDFETEEITKDDFENVLRKQKPSLSQRQIDAYVEFQKGHMR